jgi:hypothetical protein
VVQAACSRSLSDFRFCPQFNLLFWASAAGVVGLVWTLPNAVILYSQRAEFAEPAKEKPGG